MTFPRLAIVILFGLLSSTILNMLVVPALFVRFGRPLQTEATVGVASMASSDGGL